MSSSKLSNNKFESTVAASRQMNKENIYNLKKIT